MDDVGESHSYGDPKREALSRPSKREISRHNGVLLGVKRTEKGANKLENERNWWRKFSTVDLVHGVVWDWRKSGCRIRPDITANGDNRSLQTDSEIVESQ